MVDDEDDISSSSSSSTWYSAYPPRSNDTTRPRCDIGAGVTDNFFNTFSVPRGGEVDDWVGEVDLFIGGLDLLEGEVNGAEGFVGDDWASLMSLLPYRDEGGELDS